MLASERTYAARAHLTNTARDTALASGTTVRVYTLPPRRVPHEQVSPIVRALDFIRVANGVAAEFYTVFLRDALRAPLDAAPYEELECLVRHRLDENPAPVSGGVPSAVATWALLALRVLPF